MRYSINIVEETHTQVIVEADSIEEAKIAGLTDTLKGFGPDYSLKTTVSGFRIGDDSAEDVRAMDLGMPMDMK